jgi:integrase
MHVTAGISVDRGEEPEREHLTDAEIAAWLNTKQTMPCLEAVRLRFIVQMGTGLSFSDLMEKDFTSCENFNGQTVLVDKRLKTKQGFFSVILPFAVEVLKKWDWKIPAISNVDYNRYLDKVAINCGIRKHITSHVARHTYACYCLRHGVRIEAVKRALGHKKLETTQIYARLADMDVLEAFKKSDIL